MTEIEHKLASIERREQQLDEDRRKFTEAAIRLGRERTALSVRFFQSIIQKGESLLNTFIVTQREKEALDEERRSVATQKLLEDLPKTPA